MKTRKARKGESLKGVGGTNNQANRAVKREECGSCPTKNTEL